MGKICHAILIGAAFFALSAASNESDGATRIYPQSKDGGPRGLDLRSTEEGLHDQGDPIVPGFKNRLSPLERGEGDQEVRKG